MSTGAARPARARSHDRVRHAVAGAAARPWPRRRSWPRRARAVHHRAARVAVPHQPAQRGDRALHRPAPVGVLGDHGRGLAEPRGPHVVRPVLGEAEHGGRGARLARPRCSGSARRARRGRARAGSRGRCCGSYQTASASSGRPLAAELDRRVVLARDHVRVRHDDPGAGHPAAPLHAEAAGGAEHLAPRSARPPARRGRARSSRSAAARSPRARGSPGTGRSARAPGGSAPTAAAPRSARLRISERWIGSRSSRAPGVWSATAPAIQTRNSPRQATSTRAAHAVQHAELLREPAAQVEAEHLEPRGEHRAEQQRPDQGERAARTASASRPRAAAARAASRGTRPAAKPASARPADDQPLAEAPDRHQDGEGDDDPVEAGQGGRRLSRVSRGMRGLPSSCGPRSVKSIPPARRRRLTHRALPALGGLAAVSLVAGAFVGAAHATAPSERAAADFAEAWQQRRLPRDARAAHRRRRGQRYPLPAFRRAYERAAATATLSVDRARAIPTASTATTGDRAGGGRARACSAPSAATSQIPVSDERVDWEPRLVFPELAPGRAAQAREPARPSARRIRSRDGKVLARGPGAVADLPARRASPTRSRARWSPRRPPAERQGALRARLPARTGRSGRPGSRRSSSSGCAGAPAASCSPATACSRAPGRAPARAGPDHDRHPPPGGRRGRAWPAASAASRRSTRATARCAPSPASRSPRRSRPGSTFKIVTTTAALERGLVKPSTEFPVETHAIIDGVELENANGESCGGSFRDSFAHSCNSVFAPLGVKIEAGPLVDAAERYGWNAQADHPRRGAEHAAAGRGDRHAARGRLDRDRPVRDARHAAPDGVGGADDRHATACATRRTLSADAPAAGRARDLAPRGAHDRVADGRRGGLRHRHGGRASPA